MSIRVPLVVSAAMFIPPIPEWHLTVAFLLGVWGVYALSKLGTQP